MSRSPTACNGVDFRGCRARLGTQANARVPRRTFRRRACTSQHARSSGGRRSRRCFKRVVLVGRFTNNWVLRTPTLTSSSRAHLEARPVLLRRAQRGFASAGRACRPAICGAPRPVSLAEKRLRGQPLSARRDRFGLPRGPAGRWPLARAEARRPLARRRRVRLCTRAGVPCAFPDTRPPESAFSCPTSHTRWRHVCTNGQERRHSAGHVSGFAHANRRRVHTRTRNHPNRPPRVRLRTRASAPCAQTDTSCPHSPRERPLVHAAAQVACECGRRGA